MTSWHGFAEAIFSQAVRLGRINANPRVESISAIDYPTPAERPAKSVLLPSERLHTLPNMAQFNWEKGLITTIQNLDPREEQ